MVQYSVLINYLIYLNWVGAQFFLIQSCKDIEFNDKILAAFNHHTGELRRFLHTAFSVSSRYNSKWEAPTLPLVVTAGNVPSKPL